MVEPIDPLSQRGIVRWGGAAAISGGVYSLLIAAIYAVTRVGAGGDRLFGSLDALLFPAPALFTLSLLTFRLRYGNRVAHLGRQALAVAVFGMAMVAIGQFGYAFLGFARSGNYWIGPGGVCVELGLLVFAVGAAREDKLPRRMWVVPLLMVILPIIVIAASQVVALLQRGRLLAVDDIYFQVLYAAWAVLWIVLGVFLWSRVL